MKTLPRSLFKLVRLAAGALPLLLPTAQAGTFPLTLTNAALGPLPATFTVVEADGFNAGGTPGNTVQIASPATEFSTPGAVQNFWHWRDFGSMNLKGTGNPGDLDLLETTPARTPPDLRTTISGLASDTYEAYLVTHHNTDNALHGVLADLETATVTAPITLRWGGAANGIPTGVIAAGVWAIDLVPLGQITGTGFNVLVGSAQGVGRGDYIGVAYRLAGAARVHTAPASKTAFATSSVTFTAAAFGDPPPALQWLKNGAAIPGEITDTLTLDNVSTADASLYSLRATNTTGTNISAAAQLVVIAPQSATTSVIAIGTNVPFSFVAADPFLSGGSVGNTVQATNVAVEFAVQQAVVAGYWNYRDFAGLDFYGVNPGDPDLFETSGANGAPTLRTTIPGLTPAIYEVSLVQISATSGTQAGLLANFDLTGTGTTATTLRQRNASTLRTGVTAPGWEVDLQPLGQMSGPSLRVLVGDAGAGVARGDYLGLAYRLAPTSPASIVTQPASQVAFAGSNTTFSVSAIGNPSPQYQWRKNGTNIVNATNASYTIAAALASDAGNYSVVVSNSLNNLGGVVSSNAFLNVFAPTGPTTMDITVGTSATFHFIVADAFLDGGVAGNTVVITNAAAFFGTSAATVGFWHSRDFAGLDLFGVGNPAAVDLLETVPTRFPPELRTTVSGLPPGDYEVYLVHLRSTDGVTIAGLLADIETSGLTTPMTLRISDANAVRTAKTASTWEVMLSPLGQVNGTSFNVLVGSAQGVARGDYIGVAYRQASASTPLTIVGNPSPALVYAGSNSTITVSAIGAPPLTYQWRKNGTNIVGATTPVLALSGIGTADAGLYSAVVSHAASNATSSNATLNVFAPLGGGLMDISVGSSPTLRFVPVDAFTNGGAAGNTVQLPSPALEFAVINNGANPGFWNYRDFTGLDLYSPGTSDSLDLLETAAGNSAGLPTLQTSLSGLALANYEVFLVHTWRPDGGEQPGLRADLQLGGITDPTTVRRQTVNVAGTLRPGKTVSIYEVVCQPLGQVSGTNLSVLLKPIDVTSRGDYIGLAYRAVDATSITLIRTGGVTQITWTGLGTLQAADDVTGPYVDVVPAATSPYTVATSLARKFYRLKR